MENAHYSPKVNLLPKWKTGKLSLPFSLYLTSLSIDACDTIVVEMQIQATFMFQHA